jgi:pyruvate dehydrogenase E2 component (dihydrolipoamide acetyltransferase)
MTEINLPALKENVESVEVNAVLVNPGESVAEGQTLLEVQAEKAALDVPSPVAGKVVEVRVKVGDKVVIGQVIATLEAGPAAEKPTVPARAAPAKPSESPKPVQMPAPAVPAAVAVAPVPSVQSEDGQVVRAGPATRRLARELGVALHLVHGTGREGRITQDDVKGYVRRLAAGKPGGPVASSLLAVPSLPRFEEFGPVQREALGKVRQLTARHMSLSWSVIPHVTQHDEADISDLEAFRKAREGKGPKLTVTAFALKACAIALKQFPNFNASLDLANNQLVLKNYYHLGVAVDTPNGLLVPVIRDVDKKTVEQLATELAETAEKARNGKADMSGGTFTLTNLGGIGGTGFTPIVNWPEVAILGLSRSRLTPLIRNGEVTPRLLLPLSLSYDHRVIDGAAAARFTRFVAELLENSWMMVLKS